MKETHPMPPRKSIPAPRVTLAERLREVVLSPNAVRTASVAARRSFGGTT